MTHADPHILAAEAIYARLRRLADKVLHALETAPRPKNALDIARTARAIAAAEKMLRAIYTPLIKAKPVADKPQPVAVCEVPPQIAAPLPVPEETVPVAAAIAELEPVEVEPDWRRGYADKQAQMREQRAARTGKWPDGTAYKKSG